MNSNCAVLTTCLMSQEEVVVRHLSALYGVNLFIVLLELNVVCVCCYSARSQGWPQILNRTIKSQVNSEKQEKRICSVLLQRGERH